MSKKNTMYANYRLITRVDNKIKWYLKKAFFYKTKLKIGLEMRVWGGGASNNWDENKQSLI